LFRRFALYGFNPPDDKAKNLNQKSKKDPELEVQSLTVDEFDGELDPAILPKSFGNSQALAESIPVAEYQARPLADHHGVKHGRPPGVLRAPRPPLDPSTVAEAVSVISCWYAFLFFLLSAVMCWNLLCVSMFCGVCVHAS